MDISSQGQSLAFVTCSTSSPIRYTVNDNNTTYPNLTYNDACIRLFDILSSKLKIGDPISCMGTIKYKTPQNIRRQVIRAVILTRDLTTDQDMTRDEQGDEALDDIVNDIGDDDDFEEMEDDPNDAFMKYFMGIAS